MKPSRCWKLKFDDDRIDEFIDIRRKIGNRILRAYLLDPLLEEKKIEVVKASLRGPKDEFKDFDRYLILKASTKGKEFRILAESGVYQNLRVVGTDSEFISEKTPDELEKTFTEALQNFTEWNTVLIVGNGSKLLQK